MAVAQGPSPLFARRAFSAGFFFLTVVSGFPPGAVACGEDWPEIRPPRAVTAAPWSAGSAA